MNPAIIKILLVSGALGIFVMFYIMQQTEEIDVTQDSFQQELEVESLEHKKSMALAKAVHYGAITEAGAGELALAEFAELDKKVRIAKEKKLKLEAEKEASRLRAKQFLKDTEKGITAFSEEDLNNL